jgi:glutamate mutase epsilon subunit
VAERNASRFGVNITPEMRQQQELRLQRANTLGGVQAVNDAKIAQREANTQLMADLINIGQGVNRSSQQQLGSAAQDASARQNAYNQAKAASKAQTYQAVGSLASTAILAFAFF